ncbi:hypothetical protein ACFQ0M_23255 [Kitasatospora aburaviensis]
MTSEEQPTPSAPAAARPGTPDLLEVVPAGTPVSGPARCCGCARTGGSGPPS